MAMLLVLHHSNGRFTSNHAPVQVLFDYLAKRMKEVDGVESAKRRREVDEVESACVTGLEDAARVVEPPELPHDPQPRLWRELREEEGAVQCSAQCSVLSTQYSVLSTQHSVLVLTSHCSVLSVQCSVLRAQSSVQCSAVLCCAVQCSAVQYSAQCAVCSVQWAVGSAHCAACSV